MAEVKNVSGEARNVPALGGRLVLAGAVIEVPDGPLLDGLLVQTKVWAPVKKKAAEAAEKKG